VIRIYQFGSVQFQGEGHINYNYELRTGTAIVEQVTSLNSKLSEVLQGYKNR
jgi:hypothetical protein